MSQQTIIPSSERQLVEASLWDIIKISYHGMSGLESTWTLLSAKSKSGDFYRFIAHEKAKNPGDRELVVAYTCPLNKMQFDRNLGAILNHLYEETHYFGPREAEYPEMVAKLKSATLWHESGARDKK
jgi:hypothetical protein